MPSEFPVRPFDQCRIEEANYLLSIGREVFISEAGGSSRIHKLSDKEAFILRPGQFAFILTEEEVILAFDVIGFISIRASVKFYGLVNVSGFHVDPGYSGKLIFAVFNAGPTNIHLRQGDQIFCMWLSDLDQEISRSTHKQGHQNIPSRIVNQISGEFLTAYELVERIDKLRERVDAGHTELRKVKEEVEQLKVFNFRMKVITGLIGIALVIGLTVFFREVLAGALPGIKEHFPPAVGGHVGTPKPAPTEPGADR